MEHQFEQIENFLSGKMSETEKSAFEKALSSDENLRAEFDLQKDMHVLMPSSPKDDLRASLQNLRTDFDDDGHLIGAKKSGRGGFLWLILLAVGMVTVFFLMNRTSDSDNLSTPEPMEENGSTESENQANEEVSETESETGESNSEVEKVPEKTQTPTPKTPPDKPQTSRPIAGDFSPNPVLESEIGDLLRGDYDFEIESPKSDLVLKLTDGKAAFTLRGTLTTEKKPEDDFSLLLEIYSNKKGDYKSEKYVMQKVVAFKNEESPFEFEIPLSFNAEPRLYYWVLKDDYSGVILYGGRLTVDG